MAASTSRTYTTDDVIAILDQQELYEDELGSSVDLDAESEDEDLPEGDFLTADGTQSLIQPEILINESSLMISGTLCSPEAAERDSVLLLDPDLCAESGTCNYWMFYIRLRLHNDPKQIIIPDKYAYIDEDGICIVRV